MKVQFTGDGTYEGQFDGKVMPFGPGTVLDVSPATAAELLGRREGARAVWVEASDAPQTATAEPSTETEQPASASQA